MVEGACGAEASLDAEALTPTLSRKREREFAARVKTQRIVNQALG
jgi:hypothetical protein